MKIKVTGQNQPILEISDGTSAGKTVDFGLYRDRFPDRDWGQLNRTNMQLTEIKEVELTAELKEILIGDLAYCYGTDTKKFISKLKEFNLLNY